MVALTARCFGALRAQLGLALHDGDFVQREVVEVVDELADLVVQRVDAVLELGRAQGGEVRVKLGSGETPVSLGD